MRLRPDLVLVRLPPAKTATRIKVIADLDRFLGETGIEEFQRLVTPSNVESPIGLVVGVGKDTADVWPGDLVLMEPDAGEFFLIEHAVHVILPEESISAILEHA
jgi:hypothetical protein